MNRGIKYNAINLAVSFNLNISEGNKKIINRIFLHACQKPLIFIKLSLKMKIIKQGRVVQQSTSSEHVFYKLIDEAVSITAANMKISAQ